MTYSVFGYYGSCVWTFFLVLCIYILKPSIVPSLFKSFICMLSSEGSNGEDSLQGALSWPTCQVWVVVVPYLNESEFLKIL